MTGIETSTLIAYSIAATAASAGDSDPRIIAGRRPAATRISSHINVSASAARADAVTCRRNGVGAATGLADVECLSCNRHGSVAGWPRIGVY